MTIHGYQEIYLSNAQAMLGDMFDYSINECEIPGKDFVKMFLASPASKRIEKGDIAYFVGKSGIEIAQDILAETKHMILFPVPSDKFVRSKEYWIGWAIAYYQWYSDRTFYEIFEAITFEELKELYDTLHEADISKFAEVVDRRVNEHFTETKLKFIRTAYGCTQAELARQSGVSLRSIQMYEQRNKNINKASADTIYALSKVLGCNMEALLEKRKR